MAREGQHTAQVKFEGDAGSGVKAAKQLAASIDKLEKKVATLEAKNKRASKSTEELESKMARMSKSVTGLRKTLGRAGLAGAVIVGVRAMDDLAERSQRVSAVMNNLPFSLNAARDSTAGLVGQMELATAANKAAQFGVANTDVEFAKLAKAATVLGQSVGQSAAKSVDDLTIALARGSPKILDNLGIQLSLSQAAEEWAAANDRTVESMSDRDRQLAFQEVGLQKAIEKSERLTLATTSLAAQYTRAKNNLVAFTDELLRSEESALENEAVLTRMAARYLEMGIESDESADIIKIWGIESGVGANAAARMGFTIADLTEEMSRQSSSAVPELIAVMDDLNARWDAANDNVDEFTESMQELAGTKLTFGSDVLAFQTGSKAMADARRIGTKSPKAKTRGRGRRKKKKSEQEELDELLSGADMKSTGDALGGLDEIMDDEIRLQEEAFERGVALAERRLELAERTGEGIAMARDRELAAEMALAEWRVENAGTFEEQEMAKAEVEQINHERKLIQIDQQIQAEKDLAATREFVARQSMKLAGQTAGVIGQAADLGIISQRKAAAAAATAAGVQSLVQGFLDSGKAASAFASFNYVQGALYASSASLNFISAGLSFAQAAKMGGSGGGGGRRSTTISAPRGTFGGGSDREGDQGLAPSGAPPTGNSGGGAPAPQQPGVGTQIVVQGDVNGSVDKDFIMNIDRKRRDLGRERKLAG